MQQDMYTVNQAARVLGTKPNLLRARIVRGNFPATKVGRDWVIRGSDLRAIVARWRQLGKLNGSRAEK
jgi:excisionase family DNA binding protein